MIHPTLAWFAVRHWCLGGASVDGLDARSGGQSNGIDVRETIDSSRHASSLHETFDIKPFDFPSIIECTRSDPGGDFEGPSSDLCGERFIRQELNPVYSPEYNGVAGSCMAMIEAAAMAA